jgi:hypothetical protein
MAAPSNNSPQIISATTNFIVHPTALLVLHPPTPASTNSYPDPPSSPSILTSVVHLVKLHQQRCTSGISLVHTSIIKCFGLPILLTFLLSVPCLLQYQIDLEGCELYRRGAAMHWWRQERCRLKKMLWIWKIDGRTRRVMVADTMMHWWFQCSKLFRRMWDNGRWAVMLQLWRWEQLRRLNCVDSADRMVCCEKEHNQWSLGKSEKENQALRSFWRGVSLKALWS